MRAVNLRMADAIRYMGQDSMRTYCAFLSEHFARRGVLLEPDYLPYLPLFMLDVKTDGGVLDYSDTLALRHRRRAAARRCHQRHRRCARDRPIR
jgi:hypothetical protein